MFKFIISLSIFVLSGAAIYSSASASLCIVDMPIERGHFDQAQGIFTPVIEGQRNEDATTIRLRVNYLLTDEIKAGVTQEGKLRTWDFFWDHGSQEEAKAAKKYTVEAYYPYCSKNPKRIEGSAAVAPSSSQIMGPTAPASPVQ